MRVDSRAVGSGATAVPRPDERAVSGELLNRSLHESATIPCVDGVDRNTRASERNPGAGVRRVRVCRMNTPDGRTPRNGIAVIGAQRSPELSTAIWRAPYRLAVAGALRAMVATASAGGVEVELLIR